MRAARPHLQHLQEDLIKGERFDPATSTRPIVLGLSDIAEMAFLPSILDHVRAHAPKCPVLTVTAPDAQLAEALEKGDVDVAAALPPFYLTYDVKLHWHRRFDNEPRSVWLREQLAIVFKDHKWLAPPTGPAPFLES